MSAQDFIGALEMMKPYVDIIKNYDGFVMDDGSTLFKAALFDDPDCFSPAELQAYLNACLAVEKIGRTALTDADKAAIKEIWPTFDSMEEWEQEGIVFLAGLAEPHLPWSIRGIRVEYTEQDEGKVDVTVCFEDMYDGVDGESIYGSPNHIRFAYCTKNPKNFPKQRMIDTEDLITMEKLTSDPAKAQAVIDEIW
jgi:hypothetical protein